ncbi:MAG: dependent oxidoreductase [Bacteroidetes bacterium]|nr:dependent oxidoreductase [Bacteroidota bacterium]
MNLHSGNPYWLIKNGFLFPYESLQEDTTCDVAVIGGGVTGAIVAHYLQKTGANVIVVDRRHIAMGSTSASTALLQYEIDTSLVDLKKKVGEKNANESYLLCVRAIGELKKIAAKLPLSTNFRLKKSLYIASTIADAKKLEEEFSARKNIGIALKKLTKEQVKKLTGMDAPAALYSDTGAEMDAYRFTHGIFQKLLSKGCRVYDQTEIKEIRELHSGVKLMSANGSIISCKKIVFANGYESLNYLKEKVATLHSTYAIISKPVDKKYLSLLKPMIWETARPYLYIRTTPDSRIIIGGKDEKFYSPKKRDELLIQKSKALQKAFLKRFPSIPFETDFSWTGTFAETKDGLPYIGVSKEYKHAYFALGFGGNGIVFSQIAGEIIAELFSTGKSKNAGLFAFHR